MRQASGRGDVRQKMRGMVTYGTIWKGRQQADHGADMPPLPAFLRSFCQIDLRLVLTHTPRCVVERFHAASTMLHKLVHAT
jgi:hypothetical protein